MKSVKFEKESISRNPKKKKTAGKKPSAKKISSKKTLNKKTSNKKTSNTKSPVTKSSARKASGKKPAAKQTVIEKKTAKKYQTAKVKKKGPKAKSESSFELPTAIHYLLRAAVLSVTLVAFNFFYQIILNPSQLISILGGNKMFTPGTTWENYGSEFKENSTHRLSASYLAALAQAESGGNSLATPPWEFNWVMNPTKIYRPQTTAVGMYQFTSGTGDLASRYCIHDRKVVEEGPWYLPTNCWFNFLYFRTSASDSVEMASGYLTTDLDEMVGNRNISMKNQLRLASVIHLCGKRNGYRFVKSGFDMNRLGFCGRHSLKAYITRIESIQRKFDHLVRING